MGKNLKQLILCNKFEAIISLLICGSIFATTAVSIKASNAKKQNTKLKSKYSQIQNDVVKMSKENNTLLNNINKIETANVTDPIQFKIDRAKSNNPIKDNNKIAYLTYDDGPSKNTEAILDVLKKYNVHATFFVNGKTDEHSKEMYKRIIGEGNILGNHTYSHEYSDVYKSSDVFMGDIDKLSNFVHDVTGQYPMKLVRLPGGSNNKQAGKYGPPTILPDILKRLTNGGYLYVDWNVDSEDAESMLASKDSIVKNVLTESKRYAKPVILMHDAGAKTTTPQALPEIIEGLQKEGYSFGTLEQLNAPVIQYEKIVDVMKK